MKRAAAVLHQRRGHDRDLHRRRRSPEGIDQLPMVSNDTAQGSTVFYGLKQGNPPQVKQIWTWVGTLTFTSPDTYEASGMLNIYVPDADADGDGRPDPGAVPLFPVPTQSVTACFRSLWVAASQPGQ
jgi:hypothetical protein